MRRRVTLGGGVLSGRSEPDGSGDGQNKVKPNYSPPRLSHSHNIDSCLHLLSCKHNASVGKDKG